MRTLTKIAISALTLLTIFGGCKSGAKETASEEEKISWVTTSQDSTLAVSILKDLSSMVRENPDIPLSELMVRAGTALLGQKYVAGTLDEGDREELRIFLTRTDCILFVETCFGLALEAKAHPDAPDFGGFARYVLNSRYRHDKAERYSDRIHYTTEWIRKQEAEGKVKDMTLSLGGETYGHPVSFMTSHPSYYKHLKGVPGDTVAQLDLTEIGKTEKELNEIPFTYIPQDRIRECQGGIRTGDIIAFTSSVSGLDISHVGMAYVHYPDGTVIYGEHTMEPDNSHGGEPVVGFMHALNESFPVMTDPRPIWRFTVESPGINGIKVVRPL